MLEYCEEQDELIEEGLSERVISWLIDTGLKTQDPKHKHYMQRAIELAKKSQPDDSGPYVGAVLVKKGKIIAEAYKVREPWPGTSRLGRRFLHLCHAEEKAIDIAGSQAKGSTLYCTLEPCVVRNIQTRKRKSNTPCVELIQQAEIAKVVIGRIDWENPLVLGQGGLYLHDRGISVELYNAGLERKLERLIKLGKLRRESKAKEFLHKRIEELKDKSYRAPLPDLTKIDGGKKRESNRVRKIINQGIADYYERKNRKI